MDDRIATDVRSPGRSERYHALLLQARALFSVQGYRATSTRDIAERAGASEALLFRHFGTKERLFEQAVLEPFDEVIGRYVDQRRRERDGSVDRVGTEVGRLFELMTEHRGLFRSLIAATGIQDGPAIEVAGSGSPLRAVFDRFEAILRTEIADLDLPKLDPRLGSRAAVGLVLSAAVLDDWLFDAHLFDDRPAERADRITRELTALIRYGCTARPTTVPSTPRRPGPLPALPPPIDGIERARPRERTKNRQRRSRHEVRRAVLVAARELFSAKGYAGTTTQEIAALAQVSETSVYRHYVSKRNLFEQAIFEPFQQWVTSYLTSWGKADRTPASLEKQSRSYVRNTYDMLVGSRGLIRSLIATGALEVDGPADAGRADPPLQEIFPRLVDQLAELAERNQLMGLDTEITVRATFGMILTLSTLPDWMFDGPGSAPSRTRLVNEMARLMTYGIITPGGQP